MPATLTPNREVARGALWWLFEGATFFAVLADASAASPAPPLDGPESNWFPYYLDGEFDLFLTGGASAYDATITDRSVLPQLEIILDYASTVTYTDIVVTCIPDVTPGAGSPSYATFPIVAVIHESSPVTLAAGTTKTYKLDLYSEWI